VSVTLDFKENIYDYASGKIDSQRIPDSVIFKNPYLHYAEIADKRHEEVGRYQFSLYRLAQANLKDGEITYYNPAGDKIGISENRIELSKVERDGVVLKRTVQKSNGDKVIYIFSPKGICISIQEFDALTGKVKSISIFDYHYNIVRTYRSNYTWTVDWLRDLVESNTSDQSKVVICDGAGSARKITEVSQGVKKIYALHGDPFNKEGIVKETESWTFNNLEKYDAIVVRDYYQAQSLKKDFPKGNFIPIPYFWGLDISKKKVDAKPNTIGFFGNASSSGGLEDAILSIKKIKDIYGLSVTLEVSATHTSKQKLNKELIKYEKLANEYGIRDQVIFDKSNSASLKVMRKCKLSLFPASVTSQIYSIAKSMLVGVPVISYNCKYGPNSVIKDNTNGALVSVGDVDGMVDKIYTLLTNEKIYQRLSRNAQRDSKIYTSDEALFKRWQRVIN